jgi:acyl carrier protein
MAQTVEEKVRKYIAENILFSNDGYPYPDNASFLDNGIIDSMNVLELVVFVEDNFKITVDDQDVVPENFDSISRLAAYVNQKLGETSKA